jgi:hypothetical protein
VKSGFPSLGNRTTQYALSVERAGGEVDPVTPSRERGSGSEESCSNYNWKAH